MSVLRDRIIHVRCIATCETVADYCVCCLLGQVDGVHDSNRLGNFMSVVLLAC